jgi:hypothetical protein
MSSDLLKKDSNTQLQSKNTIDSLRKAENRDYNSGRNFARQLKKDLSQTSNQNQILSQKVIWMNSEKA